MTNDYFKKLKSDNRDSFMRRIRGGNLEGLAGIHHAFIHKIVPDFRDSGHRYLLIIWRGLAGSWELAEALPQGPDPLDREQGISRARNLFRALNIRQDPVGYPISGLIRRNCALVIRPRELAGKLVPGITRHLRNLGLSEWQGELSLSAFTRPDKPQGG